MNVAKSIISLAAAYYIFMVFGLVTMLVVGFFVLWTVAIFLRKDTELAASVLVFLFLMWGLYSLNQFYESITVTAIAIATVLLVTARR